MRLGLFKPRPPVDLDEFEWLFACFAWLDRELNADPTILSQPRSLATFDMPELAGAKTAGDLLIAIKQSFGMADWECRLEQGAPRRENPAAGMVGEWSEKSALGTFSIEGNTPVIRYAPELLDDPSGLIATLAHELGHLMLASLGDPPGGEELHEHATDCAAGFMGFGVFLANSARSFAQFQDGNIQGWHSRTRGYLSEQAHTTLLALFVRLNRIPAVAAEAPLKSYLKSDFNKALKYIDWRFQDIRASLRAIDLSAWN